MGCTKTLSVAFGREREFPKISLDIARPRGSKRASYYAAQSESDIRPGTIAAGKPAIRFRHLEGISGSRSSIVASSTFIRVNHVWLYDRPRRELSRKGQLPQ